MFTRSLAKLLRRIRSAQVIHEKWRPRRAVICVSLSDLDRKSALAFRLDQIERIDLPPREQLVED